MDAPVGSSVAVLGVGLQSWRKPDAHGMACANCHAPDAFDLAFIGFTDENIRRRAIRHLSPADADAILAMVHTVRRLHGINAPKDPMNFRPLQPGGRVLPGATPLERDFALARHLVSRLPALMGESAVVDTVEEALAARDQLMGYRLRSEPIGIEFPRWSEDSFHGAAHASLNDWLPESGRVPLDAARAAELYAAHDAYLAQPTLARLERVLDMTYTHTRAGVFAADPPRHRSMTGLDRDKYNAALYASHLFRLQAAKIDDFEHTAGTLFQRPATWTQQIHAHEGMHVPYDYNPFFRVGDPGNSRFPAEVTPRQIVPSATLSTLPPSMQTTEGLYQHLARDLLQPWWVMGWAFQPALQSVANFQEYFPQSIHGGRGTEQPYFVHGVLIQALMEMHRTFRPPVNARGEGTEHPALNSTRVFQRIDTFGGNPFANEQHRDLHTRFVANYTRMTMLLYTDEADRLCATGTPAGRMRLIPDVDAAMGDRANLKTAIQWLGRMRSEREAEVSRRVYERMIDSLERLKNRCQPQAMPAGGTGLKMELFGSPNFVGLVRTAVTVPRLGPDYLNEPIVDPDPTTPGFSSRFTGRFVPRVSDTITFVATGESPGARIFIDGVPLTAGHGENAVGTLRVEAGRTYQFEMHNAYIGGRASLRVGIRGDLTLGTLLPETQLFPN